jgi:ATP-dependent exoDNAse (exonuclease V) beta subunit
MSEDEKYRLFYVAITRASKDIKIFISAFDSDSYVPDESNVENIDSIKIHKDIDDMLSSIF